MNQQITKRFSTVETVLGLLKHREVMFKVIEAADKYRGGAIPESEFLRNVAEYQKTKSRDVANEIGLIFDCGNLLQANILNDKKSASGVTKLWFNSSVIDVFRLCKISLYRPLTKISLNASMTPIWSIIKEVTDGGLSITPGTEEYADWVGEISLRITELYGKIKANISKLEKTGDAFEHDVTQESLEISTAKFQQASKLYRREIEPLSTFLAKDTIYEQGDGIVRTLETLMQLFVSFEDIQTQELMNRFQVQYLDLFKPIKDVANNVSVYLRKTKSAISEYNALESAFGILRKAYEHTLSSDKRNKYINFRDLTDLQSPHPLDSIKRLTTFRLEKNVSFLNNVFNELATRSAALPSSDNEEFIFEETISTIKARQIKHSLKLNNWVEQFDWSMDEDFIERAYGELNSTWAMFSIPDLLEISGKLHSSKRFGISLTNEFKTIEDDTHKFNYRVRLLEPLKNTSKRP